MGDAWRYERLSVGAQILLSEMWEARGIALQFRASLPLEALQREMLRLDELYLAGFLVGRRNRHPMWTYPREWDDER